MIIIIWRWWYDDDNDDDYDDDDIIWILPNGGNVFIWWYLQIEIITIISTGFWERKNKKIKGWAVAPKIYGFGDGII